MKVLIDTNVLLSAALNQEGTPYHAYEKAVTYPCRGVVCEQNVDELKRIFQKKFPDRISSLNKFLATALFTLELVPIPTEEMSAEKLIRDEKDRPILRAAIAAGVDILLTGDKDFLEAGIKTPKIATPAEFVKLV